MSNLQMAVNHGITEYGVFRIGIHRPLYPPHSPFCASTITQPTNICVPSTLFPSHYSRYNFLKIYISSFNHPVLEVTVTMV